MKESYFLISVSNRRHLNLCIKYALAGFMNNISGVWTFEEIQTGDFVSFLYEAKAHNLYIVERKEAIRNAETVPPWEPITFKQSGRTYYFPFRLCLRPIREFKESLVRAEFAYVAENLLLRGGYRRSHFQADQTTLQAVSQMGDRWNGHAKEIELPSYVTFVPRFTMEKESVSIPEVFQFHEFILQSLVRRYLWDSKNLGKFLLGIGIKDIPPEEFEVLGEKAFPEGHVDILIKDAFPKGITRKIIIEVKRDEAKEQDLSQLKSYTEEIGDECIGTVLVAKKFSQPIIKMAKDEQIKLATYTFNQSDKADALYTFEELLQKFNLEVEGGNGY